MAASWLHLLRSPPRPTRLGLDLLHLLGLASLHSRKSVIREHFDNMFTCHRHVVHGLHVAFAVAACGPAVLARPLRLGCVALLLRCLLWLRHLRPRFLVLLQSSSPLRLCSADPSGFGSSHQRLESQTLLHLHLQLIATSWL